MILESIDGENVLSMTNEKFTKVLETVRNDDRKEKKTIVLVSNPKTMTNKGQSTTTPKGRKIDTNETVEMM